MRWLSRLCVLAVGLGIATAATAQIDPLVENSNDPLELQQLAIQFVASNQTRNALAALRKALEIYPDNAETRMWLGVVYSQMNEFVAAEGEFIRALEINPALTEVHNWFGVFWARQGNHESAVSEYEKALADPAYPAISRARVQVNLGNVLMAAGHHDRAVPVLGAAAGVAVPSNDPLFSLIYLSLADALVKTGRAQEALAALQRLDVLPPNARAELYAGMAYRDLGEKVDAQEHLRQVLRLAPGTALAEDALAILRELDPSGP